jgi:hypothetical protein
VRGVRAVNAGKPDAEESKAAFREALFAQPDAGAMAEAEQRDAWLKERVERLCDIAAFASIVADNSISLPDDMTNLEMVLDLFCGEADFNDALDLVRDTLPSELTRREAAGFARGVEAVCKIADSMSLQWSRAGAQETARRIASAGRALLGDKPC